MSSGRGLASEVDATLRKAGKLAAVLSPFLTVEEAYLLATYVPQHRPGCDARAGTGADGWRG